MDILLLSLLFALCIGACTSRRVPLEAILHCNATQKCNHGSGYSAAADVYYKIASCRPVRRRVAMIDTRCSVEQVFFVSSVDCRLALICRKFKPSAFPRHPAFQPQERFQERGDVGMDACYTGATTCKVLELRAQNNHNTHTEHKNAHSTKIARTH